MSTLDHPSMTQLELFTLIVAAALFAVAVAVTIYARRSPSADSPWFWVCVFSMGATVALFVMEGKYNHRQAHLEDEYRYGTRTLQKPTVVAGQTATTSGGAASSAPPTTGDRAEVSPLTTGPQPSTHRLFISLTPLRAIAIAAMTLSWIALQLEKSKRNAAADSADKPAPSAERFGT